MRTRLPFLSVLALASISLAAQKPGQPTGGAVNRPTNAPDVFSRPTSRDVRVEIQLTDESSRPLENSQLMVELGSMGGGGPQRTYVDTDGRASFSVHGGSTYQLTISGPEIETVTSSFDLYPDETVHRERIEVKFKPDAKSQKPGGVISASDLKIPPKARSEFTKGMKEMDEKRWDEARKHFEKAIKEYPKYDWAYNNLGVVEMQVKNTDAARQAFTKAVEINEKNVDASANLAQLKFGEHDFEGAKALLGRCLEFQPNNQKCLMIMALAEYQTHELDAALATAEKVHQGDKDIYPLAHIVAAEIREGKGDRAGAERQYQTYLKEAPDGTQANMAKAAIVRVQAKN